MSFGKNFEDLKSKIINVIINGNAQSLINLLAGSNFDLIQMKDDHGNSLLHIAALYSNDLDILKYLATLDRRLLDLPNNDGKTPGDLTKENSDKAKLLWDISQDKDYKFDLEDEFNIKAYSLASNIKQAFHNELDKGKFDAGRALNRLEHIPGVPSLDSIAELAASASIVSNAENDPERKFIADCKIRIGIFIDQVFPVLFDSNGELRKPFLDIFDEYFTRQVNDGKLSLEQYEEKKKDIKTIDFKVRMLNSLAVSSRGVNERSLQSSDLHFMILLLNVMQNVEGIKMEIDEFTSTMNKLHFNLVNFKEALLKRFDLPQRIVYLDNYIAGMIEISPLSSTLKYDKDGLIDAIKNKDYQKILAFKRVDPLSFFNHINYVDENTGETYFMSLVKGLGNQDKICILEAIIRDAPDETIRKILIKKDSIGENVLHKAAWTKNTDLVFKLLGRLPVDEQINILNLEAANGRSPYNILIDDGFNLNWKVAENALKEKKKQILKAISTGKSDSNEMINKILLTEDKQGENELHEAAWTGDINFVFHLLSYFPVQEQIAILDRKSKSGNSVLDILINNAGNVYKFNLSTSKDKEIQKQIEIERKKNILQAKKNVSDDLNQRKKEILQAVENDKCMHNGTSALHIACAQGDLRKVKLLLESGAAAHNKNAEGMLPIHCAAEKGHVEILKELKKYGYEDSELAVKKVKIGSEIVEKTTSAFALAAENGHLEAVKYFFENGKKNDLNSIKKAVYLATRNGSLDIIEYFLKKGVDVKSFTDSSNKPLIDKLHQHKHDYIEHYEGQSPLYIAIEKKYSHLAKILSEKKDYLDELNLSIKNGNIKVLEYILKNIGLDIVEKNLILHTAVKLGQNNIVEFILKNGADVNSHLDELPLVIATREGDEQMVKLLIASGANINQVDTQNKTALQHSVKLENRENITAILLEKGAQFPTTAKKFILPYEDLKFTEVTISSENLVKILNQIFIEIKNTDNMKDLRERIRTELIEKIGNSPHDRKILFDIALKHPLFTMHRNEFSAKLANVFMDFKTNSQIELEKAAAAPAA